MTEDGKPQEDNVIQMPGINRAESPAEEKREGKVIEMPGPQGAEPQAAGMPTAEEIKEAQQKMEAALADPRLQQFASAIVLGNQLYAWAVMFMQREPGYDKDILATLIDIVQRSMLDENGVPRPFTEESLLGNLGELIPFLKTEVAKHAEQRNAISKLTDDMVAEAVAGARTKTEETNKENS